MLNPKTFAGIHDNIRDAFVIHEVITDFLV